MRDEIFVAGRERIGDFIFDEEVANVFPDMIKRSVPGYASIVRSVGMIAEKYAVPGTTLYDLGCSLGACTRELCLHAPKGVNVIGIDNSTAMTSKAAQLIEKIHSPVHAEIKTADITKFEYEPSSIVIMNFILQFIPLDKRQDLLKKIADSMVPGGILILSEKFKIEDPVMNQELIDLHLNFKRANGYSELEISRKRSSLENVMITETPEKRIKNLLSAGFSNASCWFQCFNFGSIIALKGKK